jgi:hypothetical protein
LGYVAQWNGTAWTNMGHGFNNRLTCMTVAPDGTLYAGGWFTNAAPTNTGVISPVKYVARWDAANGVWTNVGSGFNNWVYALATGPDGTLYAGGAFTNTWDADGVDTNAPKVKVTRIARWDGSRWLPMGQGMQDSVLALATDPVDGAVYAGGFFKTVTQEDGTTTNTWYVAKWGAPSTGGGGGAGGVTPTNGPAPGGFEVVISGSDLSDGTMGDVTLVTLCGATATVTAVHGSTQIVVNAGGAIAAGMGDVRVVSTSQGETVASNAFEYVMAEQTPLAFAPTTPLPYGTTNGLSAEGGSGTGALTFAVLAGPGAITGGTNLAATGSIGNISVRAAKAGDAWYGPTAVTAIVAAAKGGQTIDFPAIGNQIATNTVGLAATASSGLSPWFVLVSGPAVLSGGTNLTFTGEGTVKVLARQTGDANWNAAPDVTNEFSVAKATATVELHNLGQTYDGTPRVAAATTTPTGLAVRITYNGSTNAPINQGNYAVTGTVDNAMWQGTATGTLAVAGLTQSITFAPIAPQKTTASVGLSATGGASGNPVTFAVASGPGSIAGATNLTFTGPGDVTVVASQEENINYGAAPNVTNIVRVFVVTPDNGPLAGGNAVTVSNGNFGTVTNVVVGSAGVAPVSSGADWLMLAMPAGAEAGTVDVTVQADGEGDIVLPDAYSYNAAGSIATVAPASGIETGAFEVVIGGLNLGDGGDITNVTLCGAAAAIQSQSATQVVVVAAAGTPGVGDVRVFSTRFGETVASDAFEYIALDPPEMIVLGTNGAEIASGEAAQTGNGTAFSLLEPGQDEARVFSITNGGVALLEIAGWGSSDARFAVEGLPATVPDGTLETFTVRFTPDGPGAFAAAIVFTNNTDAATFTLNVSGAVWAVAPTDGPFAGGNTITVIAGGIGAGADVYSATIGGAEGTITAQTATSVTFAAGANATEGLKDIVIRSASAGATTLAGAYTVNPAGEIAGGAGGQRWADYRVNFFGSGSTDPNKDVRYPTNAAPDGTGRWTYYNNTTLAGGFVELVSTNGLTNGVFLAAKDYDNQFATDGIRAEPVDWISQIAATNFLYGTTATMTNRVVITNLPGADYRVDVFAGYGAARWEFNCKLFEGVWTSGMSSAGGSWGTNASAWQNSGGGGMNLNVTNAAWYPDRYITWSNVAPVDRAVTVIQWTNSYSSTFKFLNAMRISGWEPTGEGGAGVDPAFGPLAGGYPVTILGTNLCDGTTGDVRVWLAGVEAAVQSVSGSTQIVVTAGAAAFALTGDVVVESVRFGTTVREDAFTYRHAADFRVLGLDGAEIADNETPRRSKGTDFGEAGTGMAVTNVFTIENPGETALAISGWTTNGAGAASFRVVGAPASVPAGERGYLTVAFEPAGAGELAARIDFANDSGMTPYRLNVSGTGLDGSLRISGDGAFGAVQTGGTLERTFTLRNVGGTTLNVDQADLSDAVNYAQTGIPASLAAGSSADFTITFQPQSDGVKAGTLTVGTVEGSEYVLALSGEGISQTLLAVRGTNGVELADGAVPSLAAGTDFGFAARSAPVSRTFTIANAGNQTLHVWGITVEGAGAGKFALSGVPSTVAGGATATFTVTFLDHGPGGTFEAEVRVATDVEPSPFTVNVRALGQEDGMTFATAPVTGATVGVVYRYEPRAVDLVEPGLAVAYTASNLPAWLTFSPGGGDAIISTRAGRSQAQVVGGQTIYTSGFSGDGGPATNADFASPVAVAVDRLGNVYVADADNFRIRRIAAADGQVETIAGDGSDTVAGDGGAATAAGLGAVRQIALAPNGELYLSTDRTIRRVDADGVIHRVAGTAALGFSGVGGAATNAALNLFAGLAVDGDTNVYFTAQGAEPYVCRVDATGVLHVAATATTLAASANIALDSQGRLHYAEAGRIVRIEAGGALTEAADGTAITLSGLALGGDDTLYYAQDSRVFTVDADLNPAEGFAGTGANGFSGDGGPATDAALGGAVLGLTAADDGRVFIADSFVNRVREITPDWPGLSGTPAAGDAGTTAEVTVNAANSRADVEQIFEIAVAGRAEPAYLNVSNNAGFGGSGALFHQSYPTVELGSQLALTLAITNSGSAPMHVSGTTVDGSASFQITNVPALLPAGAASNVLVTFRPTSVGLQGAAIDIAHSGPDSPLRLSVGGSSVLPGEMGVDPAALNFTATYGGANPADQTVVLTNKGGVAYVFEEEAIGGTWFSFAPPTDTVGPFSGMELTGSVDLAGLDAGTHTLTSRLSSATASNSPVDVLVQLTLAKAAQAITYTPLGDQTVTAEIGLEATASSGLAVQFVVTDGPAQIAGGTNLTFQNEGTVTLEVRQPGNVNYHAAPTLTNRFNVTKTPLTISITNVVNKTYDGAAVGDIGVETTPVGIDCSITYNGTTNRPLNAGTYAILANSADWRYVGTATATLQIAKATATVELSDINHVYDGTSKSATATPTPNGLVTDVRYDGALDAPTDAGDYEVIVAVADANYVGGLTGQLSIAKADQTITFAEISATPVSWLSTHELAPTGTSGRVVGLVVLSGPGELTAATSPATLSFTNVGTVLVVASEGGDANWNAAGSVTQEVTAISAEPVVLGTNGAAITSGEAVSAEKGTDGGIAFVDYAVLRTFVITNSGDVALVIASAMLSGDGAAAFSFDEISAPIVPGGTHIFTVTMNPPVVGVHTATVTFAHNAPMSGGEFRLNLSVEGIDPRMAVFGDDEAVVNGAPASSASGTDFGYWPVGTVLTNAFRITNAGANTLVIDGWGLNSADYAADGIPATVAAGASADFELTFEVPALVRNEGALTFTNNTADGTFVMNLVGGGYAIAPDNGPFAGGNLVAVSGDFGTVTGIVAGGIAVAPDSADAGGFTLTMPGASIAGPADLVVQSEEYGEITLAGAYAYNPAGIIWDRALNGKPIAAGERHTLGVKSDGSIVTWGIGGYGLPTVPPPNSHFLAVAAGASFSMGLKTDGTITAWGSNTYGQTNVPPPNTDFMSIAAGYNHCLGLKTDGMIAAWGQNNLGQTALPAPNADFIGVAAGAFHSLGVKSDGTIVAWGHDQYGQTDVPAPNTHFVAAAGGFSHSLGLKSDGTIATWGTTNNGLMSVPEPNTNFVAIASGFYHSLGLKSDGSIVAWGQNNYGQTDVPSPNADFVAVAAGAYYSLGLKTDRSIVAWGQNESGQTTVPAPNENFGLWTVGVEPASGSWTGGYEVVIGGTNLMDSAEPTDLSDVTLAGLSVAEIVSASATQIVVRAAPSAAGATSGAVRVFSTSFGETVKLNAFSYVREDQAITFPPPGTKGYGDAPFASGATSSVPELAVGFVHSDPNVATNDAAGTFTIVGAGTNEIVAVQAGNAYYNAAPSITNVLVVTQKVLTVSGLVVSNKVYDATDVAYFGGAELSGVVGGDDVLLANAAVGTFAQATTGTAIAVSHTMSLAGPRAVHYHFVGPTGLSADITARPVATTNAVAQNKVYDGTTDAAITGAQLVGAVPGDDVALANAVTGTFAQASVGTNIEVTTYMSLTGTAAPNYSFTTPVLQADITAAAQEIEFDPVDDQFWTNTVALTATASSGLAVSFEVMEGPAILDGSNLTMTGYGYINVRATQAGDNDWAAADAHDRSFTALGPEFLPLGTNGEVIVSGNAPDAEDGTQFEAALIGLEARTNVFELWNTGTGPLSITSIATNGAQAGSFAMEIEGLFIDPYESVTFAVTFDPQAGGSNEAAFVFTFDGTDSPYTVNMSGPGIGGGIALETNELVFAATYGGSNPAEHTMAVSNVGVSAFTWTNEIAYSAGASGWLSLSPAGGTVALDESVRLTNRVDVTGLNAGTHSATVRVTAVDATNSPQTYAVTVGVGQASQTIDFPNPGDQRTTNVIALSATSGSGLPVAFWVGSGPATLSGETNLSFNGEGLVEVVAAQAGNSNWLAAANVTQSFAVAKTPQALLVFEPDTPQTFGTTNWMATTGGSGTGGVSYAVTAGLGEIAGTNGLHAMAGTGSVTVVATKAADDMYLGTAATGTVIYAKAAATVFLGDLSHIYNGLAKAASATTMPAGLSVEFTYDGNAGAPTNAGSYAVTGTVDDVNYQGSAADTLVISRGQDTIIFDATNQVYDGTGKAVTATADSGSPVAVTYDGSPDLPVNVGTYAVTGVVNAANWAATNSATLAITKADQVITNFRPPDGAVFVLGTATSLSAQASSGLAVGFTNLTPEIANLTGTDIAFTNPGVARVQAFQAGNSNWNAAVPVVHEWRVGGLITNVTPDVANIGGGIDVRIQGLWLGDGANITTVELAGVAATILSQTVHEVTVLAGAAPATATGDVVVVSGTGGTMVKSNAFEYLWLDAPEQLDPVDITPSNLVARWVAVPNAETHYLDVGTDTNFTAYLSGYDGLDVAMVQQYPVEGLAEGTWYAIRLYAWTTNGLSWPSRTVWVPAGSNTPYETHPPLAGPVSQGAVMDHALANMFHGAGLVYAAESSDTNVMTVAVEAGGRLVMDPVGPGTAEITVTATDPATGYTCTYSFTVQVVGEPALDADDFLPREPWNPRFTQALEVRNDSGLDAIGVRVLFTNLMPGIAVENQTGTSADGRPMIEMQTAFPDGASLTLNIVYVCTGAYRADQDPPAIELQYILPEWMPPLPGAGAVIGEAYELADGRLLLQFNSVPGRLYAVEYCTHFPDGDWVAVPMRLRATANRTQWIDAGPPATQPSAPGQIRAYRVKEVAE